MADSTDGSGGVGNVLPSDFTLQFTKWDQRTHWRHDLLRLGTDDHGMWLGGAVGSTMQRGTEPERQVSFDYVQLVPADPNALWLPIFNAPGAKYHTYVDLVTPIEWPDGADGARVEMIDMDLDVVRWPDGSVEIIDQDEFAEHRLLFDYPAELCTQLEAEADRIAAALEANDEPFDTASQRWLETVAAMGGE